jgi:hypothetical protein
MRFKDQLKESGYATKDLSEEGKTHVNSMMDAVANIFYNCKDDFEVEMEVTLMFTGYTYA